MTTAVSCPEICPADLEVALRAAGIAETVADVRRVGAAAPMLSRWRVRTGRGEYLWVDVPGAGWHGDPALPVAATVLTHGCELAGDDHAEARHPVPLPGVGWAYRTPWPADVLGHSVVEGVMAGRPMPQGLAGACFQIGAFLRRLHAAPLTSGVPSRRLPPPLERLRTPPEGSLLAVDPTWRRMTEAVGTWSDEDAALLHGQLGLAHLLVPAEGPASGPVVCLIGWSGELIGPASFDLGQVMGDLLEVAALFAGRAGTAVPILLDAARAVRDGYEATPGRPLAADFWAAASRAACVKVLDHDARRVRAFGQATVPGALLGRVAESLLDPGTVVGGVFR